MTLDLRYWCINVEHIFESVKLIVDIIMKRKPIGLIIKEIVEKNNLSTTKISKELDMSRQQVYNTFKRSNMHEGEISKWAAVLGVSTETLSDDHFYDAPSNKSVDNGLFGSEVLQNIQKLLEEEIREKNEQIRALQEALRESQQMAKALLGKSREYPTNAVIPDHMNGRFWSNI